MNGFLRHRSVIASLAAAVLAGCTTATTAIRPTPGQHPQHAIVRTSQSAEIGYQLFVPPGYPGGRDQRWPLIVFLHGAGERGTNLDLVTVHGPPKIVKSRTDFPFVVASPQCPPDSLWDIAILDAWLDQLLSRYAIDPGRVYLTGLSMGGNGTWAWATARPERFAAAAPICGWGDPVRVWIASGPRREALKTLPVWAFHGAKDTVIPLADSQAMVQAFGRIGNTVQLTVYPEAGHDAWSSTYANQALYDWFLQHHRP